MEKNGNNIMQGASFNVLALSKVKTSEPKKEATLGDLFKCVTLLSEASVSLGEYAMASNDEFTDKVNMYLDGLVKVQQGMLDIAKEKVTQVHTKKAPEVVTSPAVDQPVITPAKV
jgi:hypothetical protein